MPIALTDCGSQMASSALRVARWMVGEWEMAAVDVFSVLEAGPAEGWKAVYGRSFNHWFTLVIPFHPASGL